MLYFLDALLTLLHVTIITINLFGWILPATRRFHFVFILITSFCWFILGIWFGMGYCPITDWQWKVKEQLGERNLPASFITYYVNKITHKTFSDGFINVFTLICFLVAAMLSVYFNFIKGKKKK
ncbi:MAG: DUF2784 domain-containing protein [Ginsengibacter sp.]